MRLVKILIVDDEAPARQRIVNLLEDIQVNCPCELVGAASDGQTALDIIVEQHPDIILLDVQMPGMTGIELAQHIARAGIEPLPAIIFVTAYDEYALKAFEVHAMDYLLKPVRASRLQEAIERIQQFRIVHREDPRNRNLVSNIQAIPKVRQNFSVLEKNRVLLIPVHEVLFLKAELKYVTIQTKLRSYLTEESLVSIESEMGESFVRVHRNALVARAAILGVERASSIVDGDDADKSTEKNSDKGAESWQVIVRDADERLPISRRQWSVIKALVK
jgi:two-component system response regulator AlgR